MKNSFKVTLNEQIIYSYKSKSAPARLRRFLDEMDNAMQKGIDLGDTRLDMPTEFQKLQYVAMQLFHALDSEDNNQAEIMSAYLSSRNADLTEIYITQNDDLINLTLK